MRATRRRLVAVPAALAVAAVTATVGVAASRALAADSAAPAVVSVTPPARGVVLRPWPRRPRR